jgi:hypothetical protein
MFYFILFIKILFIIFTPIIAIRYFNRFNKISIFLYFFWLFVVFIIAYLPINFWYYKNEINVQSLVSQNLFLFISFVLILIPFLYFYMNRKFSTSKYIKISNNMIALILLLIGSCIYGLVETYIYTIRLPLDKICYQKHSSDDLKLNCCLNAEYVWNEGFSFSDTPPKECKIFMDWNN